MTETILKALMRLFAIVTQVHPKESLSGCRAIIESYLKQLVSPGKVNQYLIMYDFYHSSLREREMKTGEKQLSLFSVKAIIICEDINKVLDVKQKLLILMQLFEILNLKEVTPREEVDFIHAISTAFKFDDLTFKSCKSFVLDSLYEVPDKESVLIVDGQNETQYRGIRHLYREYFKGKLVFLHVEPADTYLFRNIEADDRLYYKGQQVIPYRSYYMEKGSTLKSPLIGTIYYSDIVKEFLRLRMPNKVNFAVEKAEFRFKNSDNGIHSFTMYEESGVMLGIMGGSGVGKSTLLNLLNGNLKPKRGRVLINGYNIHSEKEAIKGIIGYIPQDDLLMEELTVEQNVYYNAKLCFKNLDDASIKIRVEKVLKDLQLYEIRHLVVGNPLKKFISGGQRKRLNIALELIREPYVLFVDEPTSGLSSSDSDVVIDLLKEQSLNGKLVVVNIHQPSSHIYKRFDRMLVMDKGGRIVFHGNPLDALVYFKSHNQLINAEDGECPTCGNVNPEQLLQILESKKVDEAGYPTLERQVSPDQWYDSYKKKLEPSISLGAEIKSDLPKNDFEVPDRFVQFKIFSIRNLLSKITDKQYLLINLLEAPFLAFILGWFTKFNAGTLENVNAYIFSENVNLPVYLFMSVIVALFLGLMVSAEEIIRDRRILQRESFLNLSRFSYYNSKIVLLVVLSAIQTFLFVWVGNSILQIKGLFFYYWLMLFSVSVLSNLIGLNISAALKSVVSIYILIPLLLVPQIILGGAMIRFDKLNARLTNPQYVPIVGDLMVSRWAYEALAVNQFRNNAYQKQFFRIDQMASDAAYKINYLIPELRLKLATVERNVKTNANLSQVQEDMELLEEEILSLGAQMKGADVRFVSGLNPVDFGLSTANKIRTFIDQTRGVYSRALDDAVEEKDKQLLNLRESLGGSQRLTEFRQSYFSNSLEEILLSKRDALKIQEYDNRLIRKDDPVYKLPEHPLGRAHFFAAEKRIGNDYIATYWFNLLVILLMGVVFYLALLYDLLKKFINFIEYATSAKLYARWKYHVVEAIKPIIRNQ